MGMKKIEHSEEIQNSGFRMEVGEWVKPPNPQFWGSQ